MAEDYPLPGHMRDGAAEPAHATTPDAAAAPEAIFQESAADAREFLELIRLIESFRVHPEKGGSYIVTGAKLAGEYFRVTNKIPTVRVIKACEFVASQCRPMQSAQAVAMALDRMYGAVKKNITITITPEQAARMSEDEINEALRKMGLPAEALN